MRYSDGQPLPVLDTPGGKQYVISEEGCEYKVVLTTGSRFPHSAREDIRITVRWRLARVRPAPVIQPRCLIHPSVCRRPSRGTGAA